MPAPPPVGPPGAACAGRPGPGSPRVTKGLASRQAPGVALAEVYRPAGRHLHRSQAGQQRFGAIGLSQLTAVENRPLPVIQEGHPIHLLLGAFPEKDLHLRPLQAGARQSRCGRCSRWQCAAGSRPAAPPPGKVQGDRHAVGPHPRVFLGQPLKAPQLVLPAQALRLLQEAVGQQKRGLLLGHFVLVVAQGAPDAPAGAHYHRRACWERSVSSVLALWPTCPYCSRACCARNTRLWAWVEALK